MSSASSFVPRYFEIEQALRERIARLSSGDPLPSDAMICEEFGVSRMTARNAVQRLVQEGLVARVPGRGTFVAERPGEGRADSSATRQALADAALLLEVLAAEREAAVPRLAELTARDSGDVQRLVEILEGLDLVEPGAKAATYRLGLGLLRLGSAVVARFDERQAALPVMERIHRETEQTVYLCVRRGWEAVCIERIDGLWVQSLVLLLGGSLPLHVGASPRALLAHETRELWEEYVARGPLEARTPDTPVTRKALFAELERVLETGCSLSDGDVTAGIASIGAPIFSHDGSIRAAVSIGGTRPTVLGEGVEARIALLVEGATEISRALGWSGPG